MLPQNALKILKELKETDTVLDVGGWHSPFNRANAVIDLMPYETRNQNGSIMAEKAGPERFSKDTYVQWDICSTEPWPFKDKQFDFVVCSHTLEDIRDPIHVCKEIIRVGKAGYIETPSRLVESIAGTERRAYCGYYHHRWFCEVENDAIRFLFKSALIHSSRKFHLKKPLFKKLHPHLDTAFLFWKDSFKFEERIIIDREDMKAELIKFKKNAEKQSRLFVSKSEFEEIRASGL